MLFEQFEIYQFDEWHSGFIRSITHQLYNNAVHMVSCEFETDYFTDHCFASYGIDFPAQMSNAVTKRKAEFLAGRFVAKQALSALGFSSAELQLGIADDRSPLWPTRVTGSISHTTQIALCCVATKTAADFIGIDAEPVLSAEIAQSVAADIHDDAELNLVTRCGYPTALATTLIFSAKESLYKALYPVVRNFFGFETARVSKLDLENQSLSLSLCSTFAQSHKLKSDYSVHYSIKGQVVHTLLMQ